MSDASGADPRDATPAPGRHQRNPAGAPAAGGPDGSGGPWTAPAAGEPWTADTVRDGPADPSGPSWSADRPWTDGAPGGRPSAAWTAPTARTGVPWSGDGAPAGPPGGAPRAAPPYPDASADDPGDRRPPGASHWFDADAGPVVRPYAMTRGRTSTATRHKLDLIALVVPEAAADDPGRDQTLSPEHVEIVERCVELPQSIAELAACLDLPVGVVRVLVGDLVDDELVHVTRPVPPAELPDVSILREVINGLRAL